VAEALATDVGDAVLGAVDDEAMQVLTAPAEHGLHDGVQTGERGLARRQQPPPDQRADPRHHDPQPIHHSRITDSRITDSRIGAGSDPGELGHHAILARYRGVGAGVGAGERRYW
jgi:hypothetical protein